MKKYFYVVAYYPVVADADDAILSFEHSLIEAKDEEEAYCLGKFDTEKGQFVNDYVIDLGRAELC